MAKPTKEELERFHLDQTIFRCIAEASKQTDGSSQLIEDVFNLLEIAANGQSIGALPLTARKRLINSFGHIELENALSRFNQMFDIKIKPEFMENEERKWRRYAENRLAAHFINRTIGLAEDEGKSRKLARLLAAEEVAKMAIDLFGYVPLEWAVVGDRGLSDRFRRLGARWEKGKGYLPPRVEPGSATLPPIHALEDLRGRSGGPTKTRSKRA